MLGVPHSLKNESIETQIPPEIVRKILRSTIQFPFAEDVEAVVIDHENSAGAIAASRSKRARINPFRSAMQRVRRRVAGSCRERFRFNHLDDLRLSRIGLGVDNVYARRVDAGNDEVAPLHVRMRRVGAQARAAGVPSEMMQLVADVGHIQLADDAAVPG
jgi:hypothetical protein